MTGTNDIMESLQALLAQHLQQLKRIYLNEVPKDFKRPSALIQSVRTAWEDASSGMIEVTEYLLVTLFEELDQYNRTSPEKLAQLQYDAMLLFRPGYLKVGNRALRILASTGGRDNDRAYIDLQLNYLDERKQTTPTEPPAESVQIELKKG